MFLLLLTLLQNTLYGKGTDKEATYVRFVDGNNYPY